MDQLGVMSKCSDGSCCCIPHRSMIALISVIGLAACILDMLTSDSCPQTYNGCGVSAQVETARQLLVTLFQMANLLLLLASIVENAILVQLYVWYTLGFVVMGLVITIVEFLFKYKNMGSTSLIGFVAEVGFLFMLFRCLPLVDTYRKHLIGDTSIL
ncbi:unnamed protein product [Chrysodeixis includens]|uniref:Uncharacterized protein n=1 Tax=Chrysodeixis includens TaxID=689277 RepID=A0A9P0BWN5_CHRIL|nr:unnamed protein product [Chrysodeixis includens]